MFQVGKIIVARIVTTFGTAAIAANAVGGVINSFSYMEGQAFSMALLTVTGQCVGARAYSEARRLVKKVVALCTLAIWVTSALILVFMQQITGLFSLSAESAAICRNMLTVYAVFAGLAWPPSFCLPSALRAAGDARFCMVTSACTMFTIRVSSSFFFCYTLKLGAPGIYYAMGCDFVFRAAIYFLRWRSGKWMTKVVLR
jgi:Na+-driven multidrug efflux pump